MKANRPPRELYRLEYTRRPPDTGPILCVKWFASFDAATEYQAELKRKPDATSVSLAEYHLAWVIVDD